MNHRASVPLYHRRGSGFDTDRLIFRTLLEKVVPDRIKLALGVNNRQAAKIACIVPNRSQALKFIDCVSDFKIYVAIPFFRQPVFDTSIELFITS